MQRVALVTDSTAGISPAVAAEHGIIIVPASFAFAEERFFDGSAEASAVYGRMESEGLAPRAFGVTESGFRAAFEGGLRDAESVFCLVSPFDVNPSFTTACAAMLAIQFDEPEAKIKVANAGVGSAGLGALMLTLASIAATGAGTEHLLEAVESLEPQCDSLFVPRDSAWMERAGRLNLVEERIGALDDGWPVVRLGTRITGVARADDHESALERAVATVGKRAAGQQLNVTIVHADCSDLAETMAERVRELWDVARLEVSELSATHGSQLGPGAIGIGVCPVSEGVRDA